ncbi:TPA: ErmCL family antibiotic resistance leader peptide [Streptococcus agalactiae]
MFSIFVIERFHNQPN